MMGGHAETSEVVGTTDKLTRQPFDPKPEHCYYCDPYSYPGIRFPGEHLQTCWEHARIIDRPRLGDVGLPSGKRASWKRGIWA